MNSKERSSNLELLRIIAMLMIIAFHIYYHCIYNQLTDADSIESMGNGLFCFPMFYPRLLLLITFAPMGKIGNAAFVLISGYFLAGNTSKLNLVKSIKKLLSQQIFAVVMLVFGSVYCFQILGDIQTDTITTIDANYFNTGMAWFVGYYFLIITLADVFLNRFLEGLSKENYGKFILILFGLIEFQWAAGILGGVASGLKTLTAGLFLFTFGGYIRRFDPFEKVRTYVFLLLIIISYFFVYISFYCLSVNNIQKYLTGSMKNDYIQTLPKYADHYLLPIIIGICLFELFRRIPLGNHKVINFIASSTFMIYLLHDNKFFYSLWNRTDWITLLYNSKPAFLKVLSLWVLKIFLLGFLVYSLYLCFSIMLHECRFLFLKDQEEEE